MICISYWWQTSNSLTLPYVTNGKIKAIFMSQQQKLECSCSYSDLFINCAFFHYSSYVTRKLTGLLNSGLISIRLQVNIYNNSCNSVVLFVHQDHSDWVPFPKKSRQVMRYFQVKLWISWHNLSSGKWPHIIKVWHVLWWLPAKYGVKYRLNVQ